VWCGVGLPCSTIIAQMALSASTNVDNYYVLRLLLSLKSVVVTLPPSSDVWSTLTVAVSFSTGVASTLPAALDSAL
jgi:hypothetical protein